LTLGSTSEYLNVADSESDFLDAFDEQAADIMIKNGKPTFGISLLYS
jgi:hypothetical protein